MRVGDTEFVTSQLFFDDSLDDEIISTQPLYNTRGQRDTKNTNDNVVGGESDLFYTFQTKRMPDGAMLAWKTIIVVVRCLTGARVRGHSRWRHVASPDGFATAGWVWAASPMGSRAPPRDPADKGTSSRNRKSFYGQER